MAAPSLWAGIDAGKLDHHCVAIDASGRRLLSRRVRNDEAALVALIEDVIALADDGSVQWAIDLNAGGAALAIALLLVRDQDLLYIPGRIVHHAAAAYRGDGKTDAKDAAIIADQARMRTDLPEFRPRDETTVELRTLCARRAHVSADRNRALNRLRAQLLEYFPALERAFDYSHRKAALILLTGYQTPEALRRIGRTRLENWLRDRHAYNPGARFPCDGSRERSAHRRDRTTPRGGDGRTHRPADPRHRRRVGRSRRHDRGTVQPTPSGLRDPQYARIRSVAVADLVAATNGALDSFPSADRLAAVAGLAPVPKDSGRITGNLKRPRRYDRRLLRVFYLAATNSIKTCPESRAYYDRKRAEGKHHRQAVLSLARRRVNVLWAMHRDNTAYKNTAKTAA